MSMVEQVGSGIGRIKDSLSVKGLPAPVFKTEGMFNVVFKRSTKNDNIETTQKTTQKILSLIEENPFISQKEIAVSLQNITVNGVKYHINKMKKAKVLKRIGPDRGG
jgi:ATP-dependent DNA helicase RecG